MFIKNYDFVGTIIGWLCKQTPLRDCLYGYAFSGLFKSIKQTDPLAHKALVQWHGNWVAFMDNMLQLQILHVNSRELYVPVFIQRLTVDAKYHLKFATKHTDSLLPVFYYEQFNGLK